MTDKYQIKYRIKSARLPHCGYSRSGAYYVTICTKNRECFFGNVKNYKMQFSDAGTITNQFFWGIPIHFPIVRLDAFVVMPNHVHGIVIIDNPNNDHDQNGGGDGDGRDVACNVSTNEQMSNISPKSGSLSTIIRSYKSAVTTNAKQNNLPFGWQPRFHDHIIHNEPSYNNIRQYIN